MLLPNPGNAEEEEALPVPLLPLPVLTPIPPVLDLFALMTVTGFPSPVHTTYMFSP